MSRAAGLAATTRAGRGRDPSAGETTRTIEGAVLGLAGGAAAVALAARRHEDPER